MSERAERQSTNDAAFVTILAAALGANLTSNILDLAKRLQRPRNRAYKAGDGVSGSRILSSKVSHHGMKSCDRVDQALESVSMTLSNQSQLGRRSRFTAAVDDLWQLGKMATNFELWLC